MEKNILRQGEERKLISTYVIATLRNDPFPIFGDEELSLDFASIDEVVNVRISAPRNSTIVQAIDIGTGVGKPVKEVAKVIIKLIGSKSKTKYTPMRTVEVKVHIKVNLADAKKYLN